MISPSYISVVDKEISVLAIEQVLLVCEGEEEPRQQAARVVQRHVHGVGVCLAVGEDRVRDEEIELAPCVTH